MRRMRQLWGIFIMLMLLVKCTPFDYEGELSNGYRLDKFNSSEIGISHGLIIFKGDINWMNVKDNLVFGKVDELPPEIQRTRTSKSEAPPGYFILDTKTGLHRLGLEKEGWLRELDKVGISKEPNLKMPTAFASEPFLITVFKLIIFLGVLKFLIFPLR
jgi:hypothetical protein